MKYVFVLIIYLYPTCIGILRLNCLCEQNRGNDLVTRHTQKPKEDKNIFSEKILNEFHKDFDKLL